ncbi:MAG: hypothetical protein COB60_00240 [Flavobacteriaceae bacterium]|nr:MAG: hypothetical protein COB60_00240 [Flavobacteriaceae bacterium]
MRKNVILAMVLSIALVSYSQKKKNGTVYVDHPSITIVEEMQQAFISGDVVKLSNYLADDFKLWDGNSTNSDDKGVDKETFLKRSTYWSENFSYLSLGRHGKAYPDAIEYSDDAGLWVQTWDVLKGVHTKTGSKVNMPIHRLFRFDKNNKIATMIDYYNNKVFADVYRSNYERKNGIIYDNHKYINTIKSAFAAFENNDLNRAYSFFDVNARFRNSSMIPGDKPATLADIKVSNVDFLSKYTIDAIDMNGYPDYLHYERGDTHIVQSWWTFRLTRKADAKKLVIPAFYTHRFNDEGKIIYGSSYINAKLFDE